MEISNDPTNKEEIALEVWGLHTGRLGGPLGMRAEQLKKWLQEATWEMDPTVKRLDALVSMTKMAFREGHLPVDITWTNMVLLLK